MLSWKRQKECNFFGNGNPWRNENENEENQVQFGQVTSRDQ